MGSYHRPEDMIDSDYTKGEYKLDYTEQWRKNHKPYQPQPLIYLYKKKVIKSGKRTDVFIYETARRRDLRDPDFKPHHEKPKADRGETKRLIKNKNRALFRLTLLIEENYQYSYKTKTKLVTCTYADQDYAKSENHDFHRQDARQFIRRLERMYKFKAQYVYVFEPHESGTTHIHFAIFNLPYDKDDERNLRSCWQEGLVDIVSKKPKEGTTRPQQIAGYLGKYINKRFNHTTTTHVRLYTCSRGLKQPQEYISEDNANELHQEAEQNYELVKEQSYKDKYQSKFYSDPGYIKHLVYYQKNKPPVSRRFA